MCGFAGFFGGTEFENAREIAARMATTITHRGPDDAGVWLDAAAGIALAHRRLSILDLSPAGHQPMLSVGERYVIVFNGEIYNHLDIRKALGERPWRGHSDTETLLAAIDAWGVAATLKRAVGMFAFALWDRHDRSLTLARDRLGEKPLYYGWQGDVFLFGSELKALRAHPAFKGEIDRASLAQHMRFGYVPAPGSIYKGIRKLLPGCWITLPPGEREAHPQRYWSAREIAEKGHLQPFAGSDGEAVDTLESLLRQTISGQMLADVPLGAFLSGGVDSSTVVALMQSMSSRPVQTFSIGFHEEGYDEAGHARAVARHLGTAHTEMYVTPEQAMGVIPKLPALYDEPFADSSQIPTFLVSELARRHVTVSLSGDGGDELFCGYNRYFWTGAIWRRIRHIPSPMRSAVAHLLTIVPPESWNRVFNRMDWALPTGLRYANPGDKLHKFSEILLADSPEAIYLGLVSLWKTPEAVVLGAHEPVTLLTERSQWADLPEIEQRMMYLDQMTYLPDDILVKVDRAAMGVSLETRVPMLDHRLVEFAWQLPMSMKIRDGKSKWLLRQVLQRHVPDALIERPKMGFGIPLDHWLRGALREWAESLLDEARLTREGYFNPAPIRQRWQEHLSGRRNWQHSLWNVLMFQAWREHTHG